MGFPYAINEVNRCGSGGGRRERGSLGITFGYAYGYRQWS